MTVYRIGSLAACAALLGLAGCNQSGSGSDREDVQAADQVVPESAPPEAPRRLRTAELAYAVGAGECPTASKSEYKGATADQVFYAVQCGGRSFLVSVTMDGSSRVVPCALAEQLKTPCWKPWETN